MVNLQYKKIILLWIYLYQCLYCFFFQGLTKYAMTQHVICSINVVLEIKLISNYYPLKQENEKLTQRVQL